MPIKILLAALGLLMAFGVHAETWRFALIGDIPYSDYERRELPAMIDNISAEHLDLIIHVGDFKRSNERCSDETFLDRQALFNASRLPFIYVPGDNEWTDCTLPVAGDYAELERLSKLRAIFFAEPLSLWQTRIPVEQQSAAFPEHLRWRRGRYSSCRSMFPARTTILA
ncbi:MAG: metallophosphoesterase [Propionivibrio sp.]|nr:metallophosphoesterase [Propionivibrio sp.]